MDIQKERVKTNRSSNAAIMACDAMANKIDGYG